MNIRITPNHLVWEFVAKKKISQKLNLVNVADIFIIILILYYLWHFLICLRYICFFTLSF